MNNTIIGAACAALTLLATFLPMAASGGYFVNITHLGGTCYLLYPLALAGLVLAITGIYRPQVKYLRIWIMLAAGIGLVISGLTVMSGKEHLEFMANSFGSMPFMQEQTAKPQVTAAIGSGGLMSLTGYLGLLAFSFIPVKATVVAKSSAEN